MTDEIQKTDPSRPDPSPDLRPDVPPDWLLVESLDLEAQGVAHRPDGKVVFIKGALPFEWVSATIHRKKNNWEQGAVTQIHRESSQRVKPACPHFGCMRAPVAAARCSICMGLRRWPSSSGCWKTTCGIWARSRPKIFCARSKARPGATATGRAFRCATCAKKARCWWVFTSAKAAMWPT
jgi:hypothetical protein